jgi:elongation of very long chain fatty acids protein 4
MWALWDDICSRAVRTAFAYAGFRELDGPPASATADLLFVKSPTPLVTCILGYLAIVAAGLAFNGGRKRDSAALRTFVQAHNVFLVVLSVNMSARAVFEAVKNGFWLWGNAYDPSQTGLARIVHVFFLSKIYEFVDTFIMIAKGNMRQVTVLHVWHHVSISMIMWTITYVAPGGDAYYCVVLNSFVHVVMYTYYLLAAAIGPDPVARRKYLWWSAHLTKFQMAQFFSMVAHSCYLLAHGSYNAFIAKMQLAYMFTLIALFANFYVRKHCVCKKVRFD